MSGLTAKVLLGHRGAPLDLPENTLESFALALAQGADGLELDVHSTRDGVVVAAHDATLLRTADVPHRIADLTFAELQQIDVGATFRDRTGAPATTAYRVPSLEEVAHAFPRVHLNVDIKARGGADDVVRLVRRVHAQERVLLTSFSARTLRRARALRYEGAIGAGTTDALAIRFTPRTATATRLLRALLPEVARLQMPRAFKGISFDETWLYARCASLGIPVDVWVIDDVAVARAILARGASGIVTNDILAMAPMIRALRSSPSA